MSAIFRHFTIRLWITAITSGLVCTVLLPQWQRAIGLAGLWVPLVAVMAGAFLLVGYSMNRLGMLSIRRQIAEAAVWERAGLNAEAEAAFERAIALYDAFWLSPLYRRRTADWVIMRLARFCLAQPTLGTTGRTAVISYLQLHPEDDAVALGWLDKVLQQDKHCDQDHEIATCINEALSDHAKVQRLLMQFYLSNERADFEAVQTYQRVWQSGRELPPTIICNLARLLISETCINDWALKVYLKGYAIGDERCLEGIAASVRQLHPNSDNREDLAQAGIIFAGLTEVQRGNLLRSFEPDEPFDEDEMQDDGSTQAEESNQHMRFAAIGQTLSRRLAALSRNAKRQFQSIVLLCRWCTHSLLRRIVLGGVLSGMILISVVINRQTTDTAYLKPEDAQSYVDRLKNQKIEAFWTKATGANRTWYQVKVARFITRDEARTFGEALKAKGVIDDFYVANYSP